MESRKLQKRGREQSGLAVASTVALAAFVTAMRAFIAIVKWTARTVRAIHRMAR